MSWSRRQVLSRAAVAAGAAALLGACGFQPLYGEHGPRGGAGENLEQVSIANIQNRYGQQLRNNLIDRFYTTGYPAKTAYDLLVTMTAAEQKLAVRKDATSQRAQLDVTAPFRLVETASGKTLLSSSSRALIAYDVLDEQYGAMATVNNAYDRALVQIADDITNRVALILARPATP